MLRSSIERKLADLSSEVRALRAELNILDEQLQHVIDEADDARLRSLVSETPLAASEHRDATKTVTAVRRDRDAKVKRMAKLEAKQDVLLDRLTEASS